MGFGEYGDERDGRRDRDERDGRAHRTDCPSEGRETTARPGHTGTTAGRSDPSGSDTPASPTPPRARERFAGPRHRSRRETRCPAAGRASPCTPLVAGEGATRVPVDALAAETPEPGDGVPAIGEEDAADLTAADLFDPRTTGRVVALWILTPSLSAVASFAVFEFLPVFGF